VWLAAALRSAGVEGVENPLRVSGLISGDHFTRARRGNDELELSPFVDREDVVKGNELLGRPAFARRSPGGNVGLGCLFMLVRVLIWLALLGRCDAACWGDTPHGDVAPRNINCG
jgi:hypothetical protein